MSKLVVLKIGEGSFDQGYPVTLQIGDDGATPNVSLDGKLPPCAEIQPASVCLPIKYANWQWKYRQKLSSARMKKSSGQTTNSSNSALIDSSKILKQHLNDWLNSEAFRPIKDKFQQKINPDDIVRVIIQTDDPNLRRLPWYLWDLFASYRFAEVALYAPAFEGVKQSVQPKAKVRILAILGDASAPDRITGIKLDIEADKRFLESLPNAELVFLAEPELNRQKFTEQLWDEKGWDILFFAGHSSSEPDGTTGKMFINSQDGLTIPELKSALQKAIERGLQLAIFNSCDGLGIARDLADLHIPHVIVMREPVPDLVAKEFLQHFLTSFAGGKSLYLAVREARERLQGLEKEIPCASWLPVICQNPAVEPTTWNQLIGIDESSRIKATANVQNQLSRQEFKNRRSLLSQVRTEVWGLLEQSLHHAVLINLHKENQPDLVKRSWDVEVKVGNNQKREAINSNIIQIFDRQSIAGKLLILGAPGAGKTTTQLELAQELIKRAENDVNEPMPVLFNLSSWKDDNQSIDQWLINRLKIDYGVPQKIGKNWLREQQILPLLDGLDELASLRQKKCVKAINQFMESEERPLYIVVCSRSEEYELWETPLTLNGAICLSPLTQSQIQEYLARVELSKLWGKIKNLPMILDLIKIPLFLSMMTLAYESLSIDEWGSYTTKETCREYLLKVYVEIMLKRPIKNLWFTESKKPSDKQVKYYLSWLANQLRFSTEFYIESLQPDCLKKKANRIIYIMLTHNYLWEKIFSLISFCLSNIVFWLYWHEDLESQPIMGFVAFFMTISLGLFAFFDLVLLFIIISCLGILCFVLLYVWPVGVGKAFLSYWVSGNVGAAISGFFLILLPFTYILIKGSFDLYFKLNDWFKSFNNWLKIFFSEKYVNDVGRIHIVDSLRWSWNDAKENFVAGLVKTIRFFTAVVGIPTLLTGLLSLANIIAGISHPLDALRGVSLVLLVGLSLGIICGLIGGFIQGIFHGLRVQELELEDKKIPNQGIYSSFKNTILVITVYAMTSSLLFSGLIFLMDKAFENDNRQNIFWGGYLGIIFGFFLSMVLGINGNQVTPDFGISKSWKGFTGTPSAKAVIQHFILRLLLWSSGYIPWNYARFLNYATERMLLQRVGGRYRFIHRFLQEYFAKMNFN